jgi:hypothetical protein
LAQAPRLTPDPKANLVIMGDFNEGHLVGSNGQALAVLFQARPPMMEALGTMAARFPPTRTARRMTASWFPTPSPGA